MPIEKSVTLTDAELKSRVKLELYSNGWKRNEGAARKGFTSVPVADLYMDCRCVVERGIKGLGSDVEFQQAVQQASGKVLDLIYELVLESIRRIPDRRLGEPDPFKNPFVVYFCCAWGIHRSVATKHIISRRLRAAGFNSVKVGPELTLKDLDLLWERI